ncbi:MAG TPA: imidazole glycerol phosphate synthase subunit HisH, partial [Woeseiaceae bacterium]|nr:imidazole glycerol phosphate synthase subunit HisH [Woeseiaceae bacterium]
PLLAGLEDGCFFYYLHSYALPVSDYSLATATHGDSDGFSFSSVVGFENFFAAQFHPERSSISGAAVLANFLRGVA